MDALAVLFEAVQSGGATAAAIVIFAQVPTNKFQPISSRALSGELLPADPQVNANSVMDSFHSLFCRRCYTYDCRHHAFRPLPTATRDAEPSTREPPCGPDCYFHGKGGAAEDELAPSE